MKKTVMKYDIGDKVILLDAREFPKHYYIWVSEMDELIGKIFTISKCIHKQKSYSLSGKGITDSWGFPEEWLKQYNSIEEWTIKDEFFEI